MSFNPFSTGFILGLTIAWLAALLLRRCPAPTFAGERPVTEADGKRTIPFSQDRQYGRTGTEG